MIGSWIRRLLNRKPCGCSRRIEGTPVLKRFSSETPSQQRIDYVESIRLCNECGEKNYIRNAWTGMYNSPHPDWREWSKNEVVTRGNKMGETRKKRQTVYHEDYQRAHSWCEPSHVDEMGRWDRCKNDEPCWIEYKSVPDDIQEQVDTRDIRV